MQRKYFFLCLIFIVTSGFIIQGCRQDLISSSTAANACDNAIDGKNYSLAITECASSREDLMAAYLGNGGFDFINFSNGSTGNTLTDPTSGSALGTLDTQGTLWLSIIGASTSDISTSAGRLSAINSAIGNFESARDLIFDSDNVTISTDASASEAVMGVFANILLMQLNQIKNLDLGSAFNDSTNIAAIGAASGCDNSTTVSSAGTGSTTLYTSADTGTTVLSAYDGYLWTGEQYYGQCKLYEATGSVEGFCKVLKFSMLDTVTAITNALTKVTSNAPTSITDSQKSVCTTLFNAQCFVATGSGGGGLDNSSCLAYL